MLLRLSSNSCAPVISLLWSRGYKHVPLCLALVFTWRLPQPHIYRVRLCKVYVNVLCLGLLPTAVSGTSRGQDLYFLGRNMFAGNEFKSRQALSREFQGIARQVQNWPLPSDGALGSTGLLCSVWRMWSCSFPKPLWRWSCCSCSNGAWRQKSKQTKSLPCNSKGLGAA